MITKYKPKVFRQRKHAPAPRRGGYFRHAQEPIDKKADAGQPSVKPASLDRDKLKIIVLGGLEEVGRNMTILEYNGEIIIIDMGLQFPEEDMHGIDYIIPNTNYLQGREDWIKGVIITHGHYDHIGAVHHLMGTIGNPPMFMGKMTAGLVRKRASEFTQCP